MNSVQCVFTASPGAPDSPPAPFAPGSPYIIKNQSQSKVIFKLTIFW